jgi:hypothetical protein
MRREYFTLAIRLPSDDAAPSRPTIALAFEGPLDELQDALADDAGEPLPADAVDVTCRLQGDDDATCVVGLTHRLTGEFLLEVNADADDIFDLVEAARDGDEEPTYRVAVETDEETTVYDKETLLVYDSDGNLLRGQSLIPSGVEL